MPKLRILSLIWGLFTFFIILNTAAADNNTGIHFKLPNYELFVSSLPRYNYKCELNRFYGPNQTQNENLFKNLTPVINYKQFPSDVEFNQKLKEIVPRILFEGLSKTAEINPELAEKLFNLAKLKPITFLCNHTNVKHGALASAGKKFIFFGSARVYLKAVVPLLLPKDSSYLEHENDWLWAANTIYHEILHHISLPNSVLSHERNIFETRGESDLVYSCANHAFPRHSEKLNMKGVDLFTIKGGNSLDKLPVFYKNKSNLVVDRYLKSFRFSENSSENEKNNKLLPSKFSTETYHYTQCMACASAKQVLKMSESIDIDGSHLIDYKYEIQFDHSSAEAHAKCAQEPIHITEFTNQNLLFRFLKPELTNVTDSNDFAQELLDTINSRIILNYIE